MNDADPPVDERPPRPDRPLRIDLVITELFPGGAERCLTELAIGLQLRGHRVRVGSLMPLPVGSQSLLVDRITAAGIPIEASVAGRWRSLPGVAGDVRGWIRRDRPDVVQTFLYHANVLAGAIANRAKVPVRVAGVRVAEAKRLRCWIEGRVLRRMHHVVCVSSATGDFVHDHILADPSRLSVIGNGVDVDRFDRARPTPWSTIGWPDSSQVVLFIGRLHPQKGIDLLQRQIDRIAPPASHHRLLLIGEGPLGVEINRWAQGVGGDRVKVLPWQADVAPWIRAAAMLVLPSRYEGMPNVVLEAMAAGIPVLCSRVEGSAELLGATAEVQSFESGDDRQMSRLVNDLQRDPDLARRLGRDNRRRAIDDFSIPAMVDAYERLYLRLAKRSGDVANDQPA